MSLKELITGGPEVVEARETLRKLKEERPHGLAHGEAAEKEAASSIVWRWRARVSAGALFIVALTGGAGKTAFDHFNPKAPVAAPVTDIKPDTPESAEAQKPIEVSIEVDETITLPQSEVLDKPVVFEKPHYYEMSGAEFFDTCNRVAKEAKRIIKEELDPKLSSGQANHNQLKLRFYNQVGRILKEANPEFALHWGRDEDPNDDHSDLNQINDLLHPAGYHLIVLPDDAGNFFVDLFPIEKTEHVKVSDDKGTVEVPVFHLGNGLIETEDVSELSQLSGQHTNGTVFIYTEALGQSFDKMLENKPEFPRFQAISSRDEMVQEDLRTTRHHEAVHEFLKQRFPLAMSSADRTFKRTIPVQVGDKTLPIQGSLTSRNFDELAAFGSEFHVSDVTSVYEHGLEISPPGNTVDRYKVFRTLIPYATLASAPDTNLRQEISQAMLRDNVIQWYEILKLVGSEPYTTEDTREAGALMYRIGYAHLEAIERKLEAERPYENFTRPQLTGEMHKYEEWADRVELPEMMLGPVREWTEEEMMDRFVRGDFDERNLPTFYEKFDGAISVMEAEFETTEDKKLLLKRLAHTFLVDFVTDVMGQTSGNITVHFETYMPQINRVLIPHGYWIRYEYSERDGFKFFVNEVAGIRDLQIQLGDRTVETQVVQLTVRQSLLPEDGKPKVKIEGNYIKEGDYIVIDQDAERQDALVKHEGEHFALNEVLDVSVSNSNIKGKGTIHMGNYTLEEEDYTQFTYAELHEVAGLGYELMNLPEDQIQNRLMQIFEIRGGTENLNYKFAAFMVLYEVAYGLEPAKYEEVTTKFKTGGITREDLFGPLPPEELQGIGERMVKLAHHLAT